MELIREHCSRRPGRVDDADRTSDDRRQRRRQHWKVRATEQERIDALVSQDAFEIASRDCFGNGTFVPAFFGQCDEQRTRLGVDDCVGAQARDRALICPTLHCPLGRQDRNMSRTRCCTGRGCTRLHDANDGERRKRRSQGFQRNSRSRVAGHDETLNPTRY